MGNLFAYFVATSVVDPVANRWRFRSRKRRFKKPYARSSCGDTDATICGSSRDSSLSREDRNEDEFISTKTNPPRGTKLDRMYVPYTEPPTTEELVKRKERRTDWERRYKLLFPRDDGKMVIDGSYPLGGDVFDSLKRCPFREIDVEFRFTNLALFGAESWNSFCTRIRRLKLYKCRVNSSILYGIVTNAKSMISLRLIMPVIWKCDLRATVDLVGASPKTRAALRSLTYCGSDADADADIFEPFLTFLLSVYPNVVDVKIYSKLFARSSRGRETDSPLDGREIISALKVCNAICTRLTTSPKRIRSLDLKFSDGNPADGCQIIPIAAMLRVPELIWLSKVSFYVHREPDYELFQASSNLRLLRSIKWSLNFPESGSFTYNCCVFSLTSFPKLRSLKIAHSECFPLAIELLDLLTSSELKKFHAGSISRQFYEIARFVKILLRAFDKLKVLRCTPVKDTVVEDILRYHPQLEELNIDLYDRSYDLLTPLPARTTEGRIRAICNLKNLRHLTITDVDGELNIRIFSRLNSERIKSLKLFGRQLYVRMFEQDEVVEKYFGKFRELDYFRYNSCLYVLDPFVRRPRKIFALNVENCFSDDYADGDFALIDSGCESTKG